MDAFQYNSGEFTSPTQAHSASERCLSGIRCRHNWRPRMSGPTLLLMLLLLAATSGAAADLELAPPRILPDGRLEFQFTPQPTSYYRLLRGATPNIVQQPVAIGLTAPLISASETEAYFRLEQIARNAALDTDGDGVDDVAELAGGTNPLVRDSIPAGLTRVSSSPADGEDGVSVTRETVLRFSRPLRANVALSTATLFAEAGGRRVLSRIEVSSDRRSATLFYLEPIPAGTFVRVTLLGDQVSDENGRRVDADGDGTEGGTRVFQFSTANNRPVPHTAVLGRVFASELVPGPGNVANALNKPLAGVIVTVDGMEESLRAVTDIDGNFRLTNAPAGRFFVHVDGRTAQGSHWPGGDYYPVVGKAWEAVAGREDNPAGGTGEIYLPLIKAGALQSVSDTRPTPIAFLPQVIAANPALEGVQLMVPPGALFDDNGVRGGEVGIAPVSPDRLPEPLPDGLRFPIVITVQTDGPANFAEPVPVCFPNLPDPDTGLPLPPGARSALWSFDHDRGYWDIVGSMTVSADGRLICSDAGVGIRKPGWHGTRPGTSGSGGAVEEKEEKCQVLIVGPIGGETNSVYSFVTSLAGPGSWSWSAPDGTPSFGSGSQFDVSFANLGPHTITVHFTSPDGESECTDTHTIVIAPRKCDIGIVGPVEFAANSVQDFTARVRPAGGQFKWTAPDGGSLFGQGTSQDVRVRWLEPGEHHLHLKYTIDEGEPSEQVCEDEVTVFVGEALQILDNDGRELTTAFEAVVKTEVRIQGNLSSTSGRYTWSAGPDGEIISGGSTEFITARFSSAGIKTAQAVFTPYDTSKPELRTTASFRVRDVCTISLMPLLKMTTAGSPTTLDSQINPNGGTVRWDTPGAQPASGTGEHFTTTYAQNGIYPVNVTYEAPSGETCTTEGRVQVGPPECNLTISGPTTVSAGDIAEYTISVQADAGLYTARIVETSENLGFQTARNGSIFVVTLQLPFAGTFTLEANFSGTRDLIVPIDCRATLQIQVTAPAASARPGARPADVRGISAGTRLATGRHYWARVNRASGTVTRGSTGTAGIAHPRPERLPANASFIEYILNPSTHQVATARFDTPADGESFEFPKFTLGPDQSPDKDGDGLSDLAEFILGTRDDRADSDGDGVLDGAEALAGTQPLGRNAEAIGLIASAATGGYAWDVGISGDRAVVAAGIAGIAVFNIFDRANPVRVGALDLPGEARAVAVSGNTAVVALGLDGLAILDLSELPKLRLRHQVALGSEVRSVAILGDAALVGLAYGEVRSVSLDVGAAIASATVNGRVEDLLVQGRRVYVLAYGAFGSSLTTFSSTDGTLQFQSSLNLSGSVGAGQRRLRLASDGGRLFAVHTTGYNVLSIDNPSAPTLLREFFNNQFGWRHVASNGGGLLLAAADPNSTDDGDHDLQTYQLSADGAGTFQSVLPTPGSAEAVAIAANIAYVADGISGLAVIRFQAPDERGVPPSVTLRGPVFDGRVEEGKLNTFEAIALDDVGVARVDFLVDGVLTGSDSSFPYVFNWLSPRSTNGKDKIRLQARAFDTGGNSALSEPLDVTLSPDATPPFVTATAPFSNATLEGETVSLVAVRLSEPLAPESVSPTQLRLFAAGPDGLPGTDDDVTIPGGIVTYDRLENTVTLSVPTIQNGGTFRARLEPGLRDRSGNVADSAFEWTFTVVGPRIATLLPRPAGLGAGLAVEALFRGPLSNEGGPDILSLAAVGPDEKAGTADDIFIPGEVLHESGSPALRREFSPPLPAGRYVARLSGGISSAAGLKLGQPFTWEFTIVRTNLGASPLTLKGSLNGSFAADEYGIEIPERGGIAISNPDSLDLRLTNPDGTVLALDARSVVKMDIRKPGLHVLRVAKGAGDFSQNYSLLLKRVTTESFTETLPNLSPKVYSGRASMTLGDADVFLLSGEAGATYFLQPSVSGFPCPMRWSVFDGTGTPVRLDQPACGDGAVVTLVEKGTVRVVFDAQGNGKAQFKVTRAQTHAFSVNLAGLDAFFSQADPQFKNGQSTLNPGDQALIDITIPPGERYSFNDPTSSFLCMAWRLTGPDSKDLFNENCETPRIPDTRAGGIYRLSLVNTSNTPFNFSLNLRRVIVRTFGPTALAPGLVIDTRQSLNGPGSEDQYDFDLEAGAPIAFSPGMFAACHRWRLIDPQGEVVAGPFEMCNTIINFTPKSTGRHRLVITATATSTEFTQDYRLIAGRPGTVTSMDDLRVATALSTFVDGSLPGSKQLVQFEVNAGQVLRVRLGIGAEGCSGDLGILLLGPDGSTLWSGDQENRCSHNALLDLPRAGIYTLELSFPPGHVADPVGIEIRRATLAPGRWLPLTDTRHPLQGPGTALHVRSDGSDVFVAGEFAEGRGIGKRTSDGWDLLGVATRADFVDARILDLLHDGTFLYAAGNFTAINGVPASGVARWDGSKWEALGSGITVTAEDFTTTILEVRSLAFVGTDLYATGVFHQAGAVATHNLARWDGSQWNAVPIGFGGRDGIGGELNPSDFGSTGNSMAVVGNALYIGGQFLFPGRNVARWLDGKWSDSMLGGVDISNFNVGSVNRLKAQNGNLFVQGEFERAGVDFGRIDVSNFAVWTGTEWQVPAAVMPRFGMTDFAVDGNRVVAAGMFDSLFGPREGDTIPNTPAQGIGLWDGSRWGTFGRGLDFDEPAGDGATRLIPGSANRVEIMGRNVYATGKFTRAGGTNAKFYAVWEIAP